MGEAQAAPALPRNSGRGDGRAAVFGFAGWSGSGNTTLIERLIPRLIAAGVVVSLIKHAHHEFDIDQPGKDSYRHRQAGCSEVLVSSAVRWALMHELRGGAELSLDAALGQLSPCDLVLVEGYKTAPIPKLEVYRSSLGKSLLHPGDARIVAIATDAVRPGTEGGDERPKLPILLLDEPDKIATFILDYVGLGRRLVDSDPSRG
jgi:molybdopterin-guanine dinucleotide biosynthesis adapter protein